MTERSELETAKTVIKDLLYLMQLESEGPHPDDEDGADAWLNKLELDANYWTNKFHRHYFALGPNA